MTEERSCENCGNAACTNSIVAFYYDDCVESHFSRHWKPKRICNDCAKFDARGYCEEPLNQLVYSELYGCKSLQACSPACTYFQPKAKVIEENSKEA